MSSSTSLVDKLWRYCNVLRDDGMSYGDYVEQLTYLLFLKMAEEHSKPPFLYLEELDAEYRWSAITQELDDEQHERYEKILWELSQRKDLFGAIYKGAISKFRDPKKFHRLIEEIDSVSWSEYESDVKGDAYEGLLERTAAEGKAGAGQYFTARPLVDAIVEVMGLQPGMSICDPACGTGGFLLSAYKHISPLCQGKAQERRLKEHSIYGVELVESVARLCLMNLVLHGIGGKESPVAIQDSLATKPERRFDVVLANPPFGRQSSGGVGRESEGSGSSDTYARSDLWTSTKNKQLNFLQHIFTLLNESGRAAVVVPDNVLFEGGAGELIRRQLLGETNLHTLLRLPTGIFYATGIKANVLFFDRAQDSKSPATKHLWVYDLRTNNRFTLKERPLKRSDLDDFVSNYKAGDKGLRSESERFRRFSYEELVARDKVNLDHFWLRDDSLADLSNLPPPDVIAAGIAEDLADVLSQFQSLAGLASRSLPSD